MTSAPKQLFLGHTNSADFPDSLNAAIQDLEALTFRRYYLEMTLASERRQQKLAHPIVLRSLLDIMEIIGQHMQQVDIATQAIITHQTELNELDQIIQSLPGVDIHLSAALITHLPQLGKFGRQQIARWVGVTPDQATQRAPDNSPTPRTLIRHALHHTTLNAVQVNPDIKKFYQSLLQRDKHENIAINASTRKLLTIINSLVHKGELWRIPHHSKF